MPLKWVLLNSMLADEGAGVIFSGGQDSTTCLFWAMERFKNVVAVTFDYGQRHIAEIECARAITAELGIEHHVLDMALLNQLAPNSLTRKDIPVDESIPDGETCFSSLLRLFWPNPKTSVIW